MKSTAARASTNSCHEDVSCRGLNDQNYLIWLKILAKTHQVGLAITADNIGKTRMANFGFIIPVMVFT
jgi:hypothetical protein